MVKFIEYDETIFWPGLASCHYAKKTLEWLEQKNIKIEPKADNPPK
jgi:arsenate reductase-like glutaredoxin family protein